MGCSSAGGSPNATSPADEEAEEELIVSRSLRKVYSGGKVAVRNLTMSIRRGECFGFLGPNGAGKTTAISVWTGLYEPTSGSATVCGHAIRTEMGLVYGLMGVCPQFDILWPLLTVRETLRFYAQLKGVPKADWDTEAERAAEAVELTRAQGAAGRASEWWDEAPRLLRHQSHRCTRGRLPRRAVRQPVSIQ